MPAAPRATARRKIKKRYGGSKAASITAFTNKSPSAQVTQGRPSDPAKAKK